MSIIVTTHDTRELTLRCLASVHAACAPGSVEIVLVDDGSNDGTEEAVGRRYPVVRVVSIAPSGGFTAAANRGMAEGRGELLFLLNSDTEVETEAIPRLLGAFEDNPRLGVAGAELWHPDGRPQWSAGRVPTALWLFVVASGLAGPLERLPGYRRVRPVTTGGRRRVDWVCGAAMIVRREAWQAAGGFDERFRFYCQDLDLCLRLRDAGWQVAVVSGARVTHHVGATIGRRPGAVGGRYHPMLLWTDLVRWAAKRRGLRGAEESARLLRLGGRLRVGTRRLILPFLPVGRREQWRCETQAFQQALAALAPGAPAP